MRFVHDDRSGCFSLWLFFLMMPKIDEEVVLVRIIPSLFEIHQKLPHLWTKDPRLNLQQCLLFWGKGGPSLCHRYQVWQVWLDSLGCWGPQRLDVRHIIRVDSVSGLLALRTGIDHFGRWTSQSLGCLVIGTFHTYLLCEPSSLVYIYICMYMGIAADCHWWYFQRSVLCFQQASFTSVHLCIWQGKPRLPIVQDVPSNLPSKPIGTWFFQHKPHITVYHIISTIYSHYIYQIPKYGWDIIGCNRHQIRYSA